MGLAGRSTVGVLVAAWLMHAHAVTAPLAAPGPIADALSCLEPVDGVTWTRWSDTDRTLDLWCHSVGRPVLERPGSESREISGMRILSWNVHVGGGRLEALLPRLLDEAARNGMGLTVLLQETFRSGDAVPESYPATARIPRAIRPRRPAMDVRDIAASFGLSVAYVPSMRNGPATSMTEREDRGNAILSTEPLTDVHALELPFGKQRRVALSALVPSRRGDGTRSVRVVSAHLDTNGARVAQAAALGERLTRLSGAPLIIGGDLNSRGGTGDEAVLAIARRVPMASCGTGRTHRWPLRLDVLVPIGRLDFMFASTEVGDCTTLLDAYDSDHLPLLMTIRY
jgi:endonuclease/exonuclease/phosphatase family metal-dependent hydrolase